jgi:hypothetical protein
MIMFPIVEPSFMGVGERLRCRLCISDGFGKPPPQDYRKYTIPTDVSGKVFPTDLCGKSFPTGGLGKVLSHG